MTPQETAPRITPFELAFPDPDFAEKRFREIQEEATTRSAGPRTDTLPPGTGELESFLLLAQVGRTVQELGGEGAQHELLPTLGALLYHAFHFHVEGRPLYLVETPTLRYLLEGDAVPAGWTRTLPARAGYLQLPRHLVWTRPAGQEEPAEAVDGTFWTLAPSGVLHLLSVTGILPGRPGFSVLPVPPIPLEEAEAWMDRPGREEGEDFATTLPGGELDRLYSLETSGEMVKLVARILAHAETVPGAVEEESDVASTPDAASTPNAASSPHAATASNLPALRIRLGD